MSVYAEFSVSPLVLSLATTLPEDVEVTIELEPLVPMDSDVQYLWITGEEREIGVEYLRDEPSIQVLEIVDELPDRLLIRVEWENQDSRLFHIATDLDGVVIGATNRSETGWSVQIRFPSQDALSTFYDRCTQAGISIVLSDIHVASFPHESPSFGLSEKQLETVRRAYEAGYFEVPRGKTIEELAEESGISSQAVSERLRRGINSLVEATFIEGESEAPEGSQAELRHD
ncbi:MAG: helix-turn-helix domain-containing protein [Halalkalicoccus sp.]